MLLSTKGAQPGGSLTSQFLALAPTLDAALIYPARKVRLKGLKPVAELYAGKRSLLKYRTVSQADGEITQLLQEWSEGSEEALAKLMPLVYSELHEMARSRLQGERVGHTLQPTALVNEVYLKLVDQKRIHWQSRTQFLGVAAMLMRRILIDYARAREALKNPPRGLQVSLSELISVPDSDSVDILWLNDALTRLEAFDRRQVQIVELRFFVGMTNEEVAETLGTSVATVKREWKTAKAWLRRELSAP